MFSTRLFAVPAAALLVAFLVGCGGADEGPAIEEEQPVRAATAELSVTRDCGGETVIRPTEVEAGQTIVEALESVAEVETAHGGNFVSAIEGIEIDEEDGLAWFFYVNDELSERGAGEVTIDEGDDVWWDYHDWNADCAADGSP